MTISKKSVPRRQVARRTRESSSRETLLKVTVEQLNLGGESEIRLETILAEADCSPSSLYHHFGNLRGLLDEAQITRFSDLLDDRTEVFYRGVSQIENRDDFVNFCYQVLDGVMTPEGAVARSQRVDALGSTYNRPDFAKRMSAVLAANCERLATALAVPQSRGFIGQSIDLYAMAHWIQGVLFSRSLIELGTDESLQRGWDNLTKRIIVDALMGSANQPDPL